MSEQTRPPIVTILGHVDHGKTTLLDFIRKASVAAHEHGGITQAIGAYQATHDGKLITFIDTPGHAAFEKMRSRGAKVADIAVLVVAADDGVMPQTVEAIKHIQAANVPMIAAVNKIDLPGINLTSQMEKIKRQLSDNKVLVEEYGGDVPIVQLSAKSGEGVDKLLEMILLVAEVNELKGDPDLPAQGVVIESNLDKSKGPVATIIIRNGSLKKTDQIFLGGTKSKIRGVIDYTGKSIDQAGPSTPVELLGLEIVPAVGALLGDEKPAEVQKREVISLLQKLRNENSNILNVIAKADKVGSLEAIEDALLSFNVEGDVVKLVAKGTGDITEKDVELAAATKAFIVGFAVKVTPPAAKIADTEHVLIRTYNIIYELLDEIKDVVEGMLAGELSEEILGLDRLWLNFNLEKTPGLPGLRFWMDKLQKLPKSGWFVRTRILAKL
jgi:translation initiation factor IF-2